MATSAELTRKDQTERVEMNTNEVEKTIQVKGDTNERFTMYADGKMEWGSGTASPDTNLYRSTAGNALVTDDALTVTGALTTSAGLVLPTDTGSTSTNVANYGLTLLASTAATTYTLNDPVAGAVKAFICTGAGTAIKTVHASTANAAVTFDGTNDNMTFNAANEAVFLVGVSTTRWAILSNEGSVGLS